MPKVKMSVKSLQKINFEQIDVQLLRFYFLKEFILQQNVL